MHELRMRGNGYERKRASERSGGPNEPPGTGYGGREKASERGERDSEGRAGVGERQLKIGSGDSGGPTLVHRVIDARNTSFFSCCEREERGEAGMPAAAAAAREGRVFAQTAPSPSSSTRK